MYAGPEGSPSSRAPKTFDILWAFFDRCYHRGELSAADLKNCALVCRDFKVPALSPLWKTMSPPTPLWNLLSPEPLSALIDRKGDFTEFVSAELRRSPKRWERFQEYARLVRELEIPERGREAIAHTKFFRAVLNHNGCNSFLPSLQVLSYSPESLIDYSFTALLTPQLRAVTLIYDDPFGSRKRSGGVHIPLSIADAPFEEPIRRLREFSPLLQRVHLRGTLSHNKVSAAITSFHHLREVSVGRISATTFRRLVSMPTLASLEIDILEQEEQIPSGPIRAHTLRTLSIGVDCSFLTELFRILDLPNLTTATLRLEGPNAALDYIACLAAFAHAVNSAVLEGFAFNAGRRHPSLVNLPLVELLAPLFQLDELKHFVLRCSDMPILGDDKYYMDMLLAWPKLQAFSLIPEVGFLCPPDQVPTPVILDHFRTCCPNLHTLRLPYINLQSQELTHIAPPRDGACHGLTTLTIGRLHFAALMDRYVTLDEELVEDVARYVLQLFPKLDFTLPWLTPWYADILENLKDWPEMRSEWSWEHVFDKYRTLRGA